MFEKETTFFHKRLAQRAEKLGLDLIMTEKGDRLFYTTKQNPDVILQCELHYKIPGVVVQLYVRPVDVTKKFYGGVFYITDIKPALDCFFDHTLEKK